ncbi:hypothetical protein C8R44DRAFT_778143 [Mycena epipterygia]|nr:hypothetical protein C8R44DRAFT_778143 [Mycena epipterygia]
MKGLRILSVRGGGPGFAFELYTWKFFQSLVWLRNSCALVPAPVHSYSMASTVARLSLFAAKHANCAAPTILSDI